MIRNLPASMPASIPSPSDGTIELGPLTIHAYGMVIALGVVAGIWLFGRRLEARGAGTRDDATAVGMWGVLGGIIGARLYHVATSWDSFADDPLRIFAIWKGGLGIPGGIALGVAFGLYAAKRRGLDVAVAVTCVTPGLPLAQAIGRWGNWFNQELFGGPTTLPWALEVSDETAIEAGYPPGTTFHPTFLYESLWNLALCGLLLWIDRRFKLRAGNLMGVYLIGYGIGRFWIEGMRIDPTSEVGGLRWNQWVALAMIVIGAVVLVVRRGSGAEAAAPVAPDADPDAGPDAGTDESSDYVPQDE
jgi:prolipoprotein diacylglyceryl transferase